MNYWETVLDLHEIKYTRDNIKYLYKKIWKGILKHNIKLTEKIHFNNMIVNSTEDKTRIIYSLNSNNSDCLLILLDKELKDIAVITGISADYGC